MTRSVAEDCEPALNSIFESLNVMLLTSIFPEEDEGASTLIFEPVILESRKDWCPLDQLYASALRVPISVNVPPKWTGLDAVPVLYPDPNLISISVTLVKVQLLA